MTINPPNTNDKAKVIIKSLSSDYVVEFFPYDFEFDDIFRPEWGTYEGFGRMDPVMTYKRTSRTATLSFNVVAENKEQAEDNFNFLQLLIQGLYPSYVSPISGLEDLKSKTSEQIKKADRGFGGAESAITGRTTGIQTLRQELQSIEQQITTITDFNVKVIDRSPLLKISFMNLLNNEDYVVAVTNFKHKMKFDAADTSFNSKGKAIPGEFNINMSFTILHTYVPGEHPDGKLNYD